VPGLRLKLNLAPLRRHWLAGSLAGDRIKPFHYLIKLFTWRGALRRPTGPAHFLARGRWADPILRRPSVGLPSGVRAQSRAGRRGGHGLASIQFVASHKCGSPGLPKRARVMAPPEWGARPRAQAA
jgi:hypothetical protein